MKTKLKLEYAEIPAGHKTARIRGVIVKFILATVRKKKEISWKDIAPQIGYKRASDNLRAMKQAGLLKLVKTGSRGRTTSTPAVFKLNPAGRPAVC